MLTILYFDIILTF